MLTFACVAALSLTVLGAEARGAGARAGAAAADGVWLEREALLMGTTLRIRARAGSRVGAVRAIEAAFDSVDALEGRISSWRSDSRLGILRAEGGTSLDAGTAHLLATARDWSRRTGGAFDPTVGALVDAWDLRGAGRRPSEAEVAGGREASGWDCIDLDVAGGELEARCDGAWIDAGAFGKGAALDLAIEALRIRGATSGLLDFGGQLAVFGSPPPGDLTSDPEKRGAATKAEKAARATPGEDVEEPRAGWQVTVAHPERRDAPAARLEIPGGSVATTSASERFVVVRDTVRGHVLDPRTGEPAPAWGSVTVHAPDPLTADALSTALFVMGPEEGRAWAEAHDGVAALFLREGPDGLRAALDAEMREMIAEGPGVTAADVRDTGSTGGEAAEAADGASNLETRKGRQP